MWLERGGKLKRKKEELFNMSIHVVLTAAIYHGYERRLCLHCWKTAWLNFYLPLSKGGEGWLPAPVMHLSTGPGGGQGGGSQTACAHLFCTERNPDKEGEEVCERARAAHPMVMGFGVGMGARLWAATPGVLQGSIENVATPSSYSRKKKHWGEMLPASEVTWHFGLCMIR